MLAGFIAERGTRLAKLPRQALARHHQFSKLPIKHCTNTTNDIKKPAKKLQRSGYGEQGLTVHMVLKLARLGIHASNLCMPSSNLHCKITGRCLSLKLSLCFFGALLLKEHHLLLGAYQEEKLNTSRLRI
jgi:hypothetical protein